MTTTPPTPAPPQPPVAAAVKYCPACGSPLDASAAACPRCGAAQPHPVPGGPARSKVVAGVLSVLLGGIGAHKFYLGRWGWGIAYFLFAWTLVPALAGLVEGIVLLAMDDRTFAARYGHLTGSGVVPVVVAMGLFFAGTFFAGILAAIAIPNFIRYQLRAKSAEVEPMLQSLDAAEKARGAAGRGYLVFPEGLPSAASPGAERMTWSADDLATAGELGWKVEGKTYARYRVHGVEDDHGHQAISVCAETDLDGDGTMAAWVLFRPALGPKGEVLVPPPAAPCDEWVAVAEGASLEYAEGTPAGKPLRVSPPDVF